MPGKVHRRDRDPRYSLARQAGWVGGLIAIGFLVSYGRHRIHTTDLNANGAAQCIIFTSV